MPALTTDKGRRGGARPGAGRKGKRLIDHVLERSFVASRHWHLLASDDSVLDAAADAPEDYGLVTLAGYCRIYREENGRTCRVRRSWSRCSRTPAAYSRPTRGGQAIPGASRCRVG